MIDTGIMSGLQQGTAFFASSSLIALGGCFALLGATDQVLVVLSDLPLDGDAIPRGLFEIKVIGLVLILAYCLLQVRLVLPAVQLLLDPDRRRAGPAWRGVAQSGRPKRRSWRAARMNMLAGKHFNAGLRGIFFSIGYLGWFVDPMVFVLSTLLLLACWSAASSSPPPGRRCWPSRLIRRRTRKHGIDPARQPVGDQARSIRGSPWSWSAAHRSGCRANRPMPSLPGGAVVDRPRHDRKAGLAEQAMERGMWKAEVTSSQVSPGFGVTSSLVKTAFS